MILGSIEKDEELLTAFASLDLPIVCSGPSLQGEYRRVCRHPRFPYILATLLTSNGEQDEPRRYVCAYGSTLKQTFPQSCH